MTVCETILQRVRDHAGGDGEQQHGGGERAVQHLGGRDGVHRVDGGVERCPAAADQAVGEGAVLFAAFEDNAGDEHGEAGGEAESDPSRGAELILGVIEQQREADDGDEDADLVDPVAADQGFPIFAGATARARERAWSSGGAIGNGALYDGRGRRRRRGWRRRRGVAAVQAPGAARAAR